MFWPFWSIIWSSFFIKCWSVLRFNRIIKKSCIEICFSFRFVFEILPETSQNWFSLSDPLNTWFWPEPSVLSQRVHNRGQREKERAKSGVEPPLAPPPLLRQNKCDKCGKTARSNKNLQRRRQTRTAHLERRSQLFPKESALYKKLANHRGFRGCS